MFDFDSIKGKTSEEAILILQKWLSENGIGKEITVYRLKDWLISRQRYRGTPIPIVYCPNCGIVPLPEDQLPLILPKNISDWTPKGGISPLGTVEYWLHTKCPKCGGDAKYETDTMDTFVDSSWYFLRYVYMNNFKKLEDYDIIIIGSNIKLDLNLKIHYDLIDSNNIILVLFNNFNLIDKIKFKHLILVLDEDGIKFAENNIEKLNGAILLSQIRSEILLKEKYNKFRYYIYSSEDELLDLLKFSIYEVENKRPFDENIKNWLPVFRYIGGIEHATMHLLYARFFTHVLKKLGYIDFDEPFQSLFNQGMIYYKGAKMSKSKGNVVNPDELVEKYGTDTVRAYILFMGPADQDVEWSDQGVVGVYRWINKIKNLIDNIEDFKDEKQMYELQKTINKVIKDVFERWQPNTAIASLMEFTNFLKSQEKISKEVFFEFLKLLAPFIPFTAEFLYEKIKEKYGYEKESIFEYSWPKYKDIKEEITLIVQFNGKTRGTLILEDNLSEDEILQILKKDEKFSKYFPKIIKKVIYVPGKIINII